MIPTGSMHSTRNNANSRHFFLPDLVWITRYNIELYWKLAHRCSHGHLVYPSVSNWEVVVSATIFSEDVTVFYFLSLESDKSWGQMTMRRGWQARFLRRHTLILCNSGIGLQLNRESHNKTMQSFREHRTASNSVCHNLVGLRGSTKNRTTTSWTSKQWLGHSNLKPTWVAYHLSPLTGQHYEKKPTFAADFTALCDCCCHSPVRVQLNNIAHTTPISATWTETYIDTKWTTLWASYILAVPYVRLNACKILKVSE